MPISGRIEGEVLHTTLSGRVTYEELIAYYTEQLENLGQRPWYDLVDGRNVTEVVLTQSEVQSFRRFAALHIDKLRAGKVAMVASADVVYGVFRMWEMSRSDLDFEVSVFRGHDEALAWLEQKEKKSEG